MHSPLVGDLRDIIENADVGRLKDLLAGERAKALLQQTYGGSDEGLDACGLFSGTLPLLHAAKQPRGPRRADRRGYLFHGSESFSIIYKALQVIVFRPHVVDECEDDETTLPIGIAPCLARSTP